VGESGVGSAGSGAGQGCVRALADKFCSSGLRPSCQRVTVGEHEWVTVRKCEWVTVGECEWVTAGKREWVTAGKSEWVTVGEREWATQPPSNVGGTGTAQVCVTPISLLLILPSSFQQII